MSEALPAVLASPEARVVIIGPGLMGGSLAKALRTVAGFAGRIHAVIKSVDERAAVQKATYTEKRPGQKPKRPKLVDACSSELGPAVDGADLVLVATPPQTIPEIFRALAEQLPPPTIVTEIASVKGDIAVLGKALFGHRYVGSHPLVGSEQQGFQAAKGSLFRGARCVLTPMDKGDDQTLAFLRRFWSALGCEVLEMSPEEHDARLAKTSHLPHLLAYAYMAFLGESDAAALTSLGGGGLRDFSRIAASDPMLWREILQENRHYLHADLSRFRAVLDDLDKALLDDDPLVLEDILVHGQAARAQFQFPPLPKT
ncbi:prephenate dehydrogenase [Acidithiobacillus sp.]